MPKHCRACGKFVREGYKHCGAKCYGVAQRGRSREDRQSPSKTEYVMIRHKDGTREYLHRYIYRTVNNTVIFSDEIVHHANEDKRDNKPRNLKKTFAEAHTPHTHNKWKKKKEEEVTHDFNEFGW